VDAHAPDALSHPANMTPIKRREWARVLLSARRHGLGGLKLLLFSVACAWEVGSAVPFLLAVRVVRRLVPTQSGGWSVRPAWHLPPTWAPRVVGVVAVSIAAWGVLTLSDSRTPRAKVEVDVREYEVQEWFITSGDNAGVVAKKMPSTRMKGQLAPPCGKAPAQVVLNDGCWAEMAAPPPCGDLYEYEGLCYIPVAEKKRPPTSVGD
jgi:hypothetical protein